MCYCDPLDSAAALSFSCALLAWLVAVVVEYGVDECLEAAALAAVTTLCCSALWTADLHQGTSNMQNGCLTRKQVWFINYISRLLRPSWHAFI